MYALFVGRLSNPRVQHALPRRVPVADQADLPGRGPGVPSGDGRALPWPQQSPQQQPLRRHDLLGSDDLRGRHSRFPVCPVAPAGRCRAAGVQCDVLLSWLCTCCPLQIASILIGEFTGRQTASVRRPVTGVRRQVSKAMSSCPGSPLVLSSTNYKYSIGR